MQLFEGSFKNVYQQLHLPTILNTKLPAVLNLGICIQEKSSQNYTILANFDKHVYYHNAICAACPLSTVYHQIQQHLHKIFIRIFIQLE